MNGAPQRPGGSRDDREASPRPPESEPPDEHSATKLRVPDPETVRSIRAALPTEPPRTRVPTPARSFGVRTRHDTPTTIVLPTAPVPDRATLTVLAGLDPGSVVALTEAESTLGRAREATITIDEPSISRRHASVVHADDGRYFLEDLGSRNGTFVNGAPVRRAELRSGDRIQLGRLTSFRFAIVDETEASLQRRLYESSIRDPLTGLLNRRCLLERLELELARAAKDGLDVGLLMLDVDHFKRVNDAFGHLAGDQVLRALAMTAERSVRAGVALGRYGGEELVAIAARASKADLVALAERLRVALAGVRVEVGGGAVATTVSTGAALWSECERGSSSALVALADERMYAAKAAGRNRVFAGEV